MTFNFNYLGHINVSEIKNKLLINNDEAWNEIIERQKVYVVHKHTEIIALMWDTDSLEFHTVGKLHPNFYNFNIETLLKLLKPIYHKQYGEGYFIRVLLAKLKNNSKIPPHIDTGYSLSICKRTHIAIITNPASIFNVGLESKHLKEGEIWEINNIKTHSVQNGGTDRIHLILDYVPNDKKISLI